jgi:hypothetical protein
LTKLKAVTSVTLYIEGTHLILFVANDFNDFYKTLDGIT